MNTKNLYAGIMTGNSLDAVDIVLTDFTNNNIKDICSHSIFLYNNRTVALKREAHGIYQTALIHGHTDLWAVLTLTNSQACQ